MLNRTAAGYRIGAGQGECRTQRLQDELDAVYRTDEERYITSMLRCWTGRRQDRREEAGKEEGKTGGRQDLRRARQEGGSI